MNIIIKCFVITTLALSVVQMVNGATCDETVTCVNNIFEGTMVSMPISWEAHCSDPAVGEGIEEMILACLSSLEDRYICTREQGFVWDNKLGVLHDYYSYCGEGCDGVNIDAAIEEFETCLDLFSLNPSCDETQTVLDCLNTATAGCQATRLSLVLDGYYLPEFKADLALCPGLTFAGAPLEDATLLQGCDNALVRSYACIAQFSAIYDDLGEGGVLAVPNADLCSPAGFGSYETYVSRAVPCLDAILKECPFSAATAPLGSYEYNPESYYLVHYLNASNYFVHLSCFNAPETCMAQQVDTIVRSTETCIVDWASSVDVNYWLTPMEFTKGSGACKLAEPLYDCYKPLFEPCPGAFWSYYIFATLDLEFFQGVNSVNDAMVNQAKCGYDLNGDNVMTSDGTGDGNNVEGFAVTTRGSVGAIITSMICVKYLF